MALFTKSSQDPLCNGQHQILQTNEEQINQTFDEYCSANTFKTILKLFDDLCQKTGISQDQSHLIYNLMKINIKSWKAKNIWSKLDKKMSGWEYSDGKACINTKVLVIGCGPCGLRAAIEAALLGCKVAIVEKRDGFTRNNVLHLWPFLIHDLKSLGAKHFFGKFCSGSIDHISIRTLQCILLKVALILGVTVHAGVEFLTFLEPDGSSKGWTAHAHPNDHEVSQFVFDVCISADGKRNTMPDFKRKEFRGKLAIAITANFINHKTKEEASVEEISGVSYIFNQKFFKDLSQETGIDLENIVYYKDETHYFVMTAKKQNLLINKVLLQDFDDPEMLLGSNNVDQQALMLYAIKAAEFSTNYKLINLVFAHNQYGQPDVSMFDFTSMFAAENACRVVERQSHKLLIGLVGDTLLEPFWPTGSGCARGFLSALDAAWMIRNWSFPKMSVLDVIAERESVYQLLSQTTPENLNKNYSSYSIDPSTRYVNLNLQSIHPQQVRCLFDGTNVESTKESNKIIDFTKFKQYDMCEKYRLMRWCQMQLDSYENLVRVVDMYSSWKNGIALSALIHRYRPELIDVYSLDSRVALGNLKNAITILEKEFGIIAEFDAEDLLTSGIQVENLLTSYLMQFRDVVSVDCTQKSQAHPMASENKPEGEKVSGMKENNSSISTTTSNLSSFNDRTVSAIAKNFSLKSSDKSSENSQLSSNTCHVCGCRVYLVQRLIAEGFVFHRNCFRCSYCLTSLHKDYYAYFREENQFFCKHHFGLRRQSPTPNAPKSLLHDSVKPRHRPLKKTKIAERAEYTTESEIGENEDDQARHNLISLSSAPKSEPDVSTSEEELQFLVDDISDEEPDFAWAQIAKLCSSQPDDRVQIDSVRLTKGAIDILRDQVKTTSIVSLESTSEAETVGGSDADWETDTEIDEDRSENEKKFVAEPVDNGTEDKKPETVKSIHLSAISSNRMAFFSTPAQPVRIDARVFLGLGDQVNGQEVVQRGDQIKPGQCDPDSITRVETIQGDDKGRKFKSKRKPKKFTKKRRKEEQVKKKNRTPLRIGSNEVNSVNNVNLLENNISSSPSSPAQPNEKENFLDNNNAGTFFRSDVENILTEEPTIRPGDTDVIEKTSESFLCPAASIIHLSGESDTNKDLVTETVPNHSSDVGISNLNKQHLEEDDVYIVAASIVEEVIIQAQNALASKFSNFDDYASSTDADPATVLDPSHGIVDVSSSPSSLVEVENGESHKPGFHSESYDAGEGRRLSHRSASYDSCLKLSAAIDSLLESVDTNVSPANLNLEAESVSKWQETSVHSRSNGRTSRDKTLTSSENFEKPVSKDSLSMSSIASCKSLVSPSKFSDAKRRFFYEPAQPVRIDHKAFFGELAQKNDISNEARSKDAITKHVLSNEWQMHQNYDLLGKHSSIEGGKCTNEVTSLKQTEPSFHLGNGDNICQKGKSFFPFSPFDSSEEVKQYSDVLGVRRDESKAEAKDNYFSDPETSYKHGHKNSSQTTELRNKSIKPSEVKEKRRSFLSKIIQLKHEKKDKNDPPATGRQARTDPQACNKNLNKEKTNSLPLEKRKQNKRKVFDRGLVLKHKTQGGRSEGMGQSMYEEMAPIMEGIKKVQQRNKEKNSIKERVQDIAPPTTKTPTLNPVPPKADLDDFETESEIGEERLSLWSLHSQNEKLTNVSEEENSRQRKKQLKLVRRKHKEKELSRMHAVQEIMNKLEEIEIQQQHVEERGVQIERILRGEKNEQEKLLDEVFLIQEWFNAIQEMNFLNRHESELIVQTKELELEDKQYQLQLQLQEAMLQDDTTDRSREQEILQELVDVVEKRDKLVLLLEEERLKHRQYDRNLQKIMEERGFFLNTSEANCL